MQIMITHGGLARTRVMNLAGWQLGLAAAVLAMVLMLLSGAIYHFVFLKAAREGWPVVSAIVRLVVRDEIAQRDRFMRENIDVMAQKVGEVQAKLIRLEAMGERVAGLSGVKAEELKPLRRSPGGGQGGPFVPLVRPTVDLLIGTVDALDRSIDQNSDVFTLMESRLMEKRLRALLVPSTLPVEGPVGSGFGVRVDPISGMASLHTGLDFPAAPGTPVTAAAGGIVVTREWHAAYGHLLEIDHGNGLLTRYAHNEGFEVELGAVVRRGQRVARVGNTGRSTGPHLHFEVLLDGVPHDPARFLPVTGEPSMKEFARRP